MLGRPDRVRVIVRDKQVGVQTANSGVQWRTRAALERRLPLFGGEIEDRKREDGNLEQRKELKMGTKVSRWKTMLEEAEVIEKMSCEDVVKMCGRLACCG